ncbi:MAG: HDIG domain-containing protein [Thermodesulfobacteriota bacterium]|nr:HDIG domain-containing protein [Thermodesulfobacteriota bacterium]
MKKPKGYKAMNLPNHQQCYALIEKMEMLPHIIAHSEMVERIASLLAAQLHPLNPAIDIHLTESSALLHDITKTRSFITNEAHAETGGELLTELGYPETGEIIRQHVILDHYTMDMPVTEAEIVNYSDKRVLHDVIVSLDKRMAYILVKYGTSPEYTERIKKLWGQTRQLEKKIFLKIELTPEQVPDMI